MLQPPYFSSRNYMGWDKFICLWAIILAAKLSTLWCWRSRGVCGRKTDPDDPRDGDCWWWGSEPFRDWLQFAPNSWSVSPCKLAPSPLLPWRIVSEPTMAGSTEGMKGWGQPVELSPPPHPSASRSCVGKEEERLANGGCLLCQDVKMVVTLTLSEILVLISILENTAAGFQQSTQASSASSSTFF